MFGLNKHKEMPTDDLPPSKRMGYPYLYQLTSSLSSYHELFYALHEIGIPVLTTSVDTACVGYRNDGEIIFRFNPEWMDTLTDYEVKTVFCHEALHIVYQHGLRAQDFLRQDVANLAMDLCVNDSLIYHFDFDTSRMPNLYKPPVINQNGEVVSGNSGVWFDYFFKPEHITKYDIRRGGSMEYYYNIIMMILEDLGHNHQKEYEEMMAMIEAISNAIKNGHYEIISSSNKENALESSRRIEQQMCNPRQIQDLINQMLAGTESSNGWTFVPRKSVSKSKAWEKIILQWAKSRIKYNYKQRFIMKPRRYMDLLNKDKRVNLPAAHPYPKKVPNKKKVIAFLDVSGSCTDLAPRFFYALESIPKEYFEVVPYSFDTAVRKIDMVTRQLPVGGGTAFDILEEAVQNYMVENDEPYPEGIFVLTDGYGTDIKPQIEGRWHWFLCAHGSEANIPKGCHVHKLDEYYKDEEKKMTNAS